MKHRTYDEVKDAIRYIGLVGRGRESNMNQDILLDLLEERDNLRAWLVKIEANDDEIDNPALKALNGVKCT